MTRRKAQKYFQATLRLMDRGKVAAARRIFRRFLVPAVPSLPLDQIDAVNWIGKELKNAEKQTERGIPGS
jgi:hypothetical protein